MNKKEFVEIINNYELVNKRVHEYYKFGIELLEVDHSPIEPVNNIVNTIFESVYTEVGIEWIDWFMWENDFGKGKMEAFSDGELICQTAEELYDYIEQYRK